MIYTTNDLLTTIKKRAFLPRSQNTFTDADIVRFCNEELIMDMVPTIVGHDEGYFLRTLTVDLVANTTTYRIPARAAFSRLQDVQWVDTSGNRRSLARLERRDLEFFDVVGGTTPEGFYVEGAEIKLIPRDGNFTGDLEMTIMFRPSELVLNSETRTIDSLTSNTITLNAAPPSSWTTDVKYDIISRDPTNPTLDYDLTATVTGTTMTFSDTITNAAVGDYICIEQQTLIPQIPQELHPMLAEMVAMRLLQSQGNQQGVDNIRAKLDTMKNNLENIIVNRVVDRGQKIVNRYSTLRQTNYGASRRGVARG